MELSKGFGTSGSGGLNWELVAENVLGSAGSWSLDITMNLSELVKYDLLKFECSVLQSQPENVTFYIGSYSSTSGHIESFDSLNYGDEKDPTYKADSICSICYARVISYSTVQQWKIYYTRVDYPNIQAYYSYGNNLLLGVNAERFFKEHSYIKIYGLK